MEVILIIIAILLAANIFISYFNADIIATAILATKELYKPPSKPLFKPKEPKETEEERRQRILDENVENYIGSAKGQIKL